MQGYLSPQSVMAMQCYSKFGEVILSTWEGQNTAGFDPSRTIVTPYPAAGPFNGQNVYFQALSSCIGLRKSTSNFSVKVRADMIASDLSKVLFKLENAPDKLISISHLFRRDCHPTKFHPSDHLLAARTSDLLAGFELCRKRCEAHVQVIDGFMCHWAEQWIATSFLSSKGIKIDENNSKEIMRANTDVVGACDLGNFRWKSVAYNGIELCNPYLDTIIHRIEDL